MRYVVKEIGDVAKDYGDDGHIYGIYDDKEYAEMIAYEESNEFLYVGVIEIE